MGSAPCTFVPHFRFLAQNAVCGFPYYGHLCVLFFGILLPFVKLSVCLRVSAHACIEVCICMCVFVCVYLYACICMCVFGCVWAMCVFECLYLYVCDCVYLYVCDYVCDCVCDCSTLCLVCAGAGSGRLPHPSAC